MEQRGIFSGVGRSEGGGVKERHRVTGGGRSEGTRGCGDPSNVSGQAGSCVPLIKYKGINKLFVGAR